MSNRRVIRILVAIILALAGLHVLVSLRRGPVIYAPRQTLLDVAAKESAGRIRIERKGEKPVVLVREGDGWRLESPFGGMAEEGCARKVLDLLAFGPVRDSFTEEDLLRLGGHTRSDYGLDDPQVTITVSAKDSGPGHSVRLGSVTADSKHVFASVDGDPVSYLVDTDILSAAGKPAGAFRIRDFVPEGLEGVDAFDIKRGTGSFQSFRLDDGKWSILSGDGQGTPVSGVKVNLFLADFSNARIEDYAWPVGAPYEPDGVTAPLLAGYGLDPETAVTVTLRGTGRKDVQISFGKEASDGLVYALAQNGGAIVTVDGRLKDVASKTQFSDSRLFPYEYADVLRVSATDSGTVYQLAREPGGEWRLDAPVAAPADQSCAESFVRHLLSLRSVDRDEAGITVSLSTNSPAETVRTDAALGDMVLPDLRSREIMKCAPSDVRRVSIAGDGGEKPTLVSYNKDLRRWTVESADAVNASVDEEALARLLFALNPLTADKIVTLKVSENDLFTYGLKSPRWTVAVDSSRGEEWRRNILVGAKAHGGRFATLGSSDIVFIIPDSTVKALTATVLKEGNKK
ncbi:MAG: DUF4340 domain-containing protein [Kiritimatiellae bacterium]|nr:DUF4340 domain-containing protein [Kiritimatiellia bacterium]